KIEIDCSSIPSSNDLFTLGSDGSIIRGLIINHADGYGFSTSGSNSFDNNIIAGNFIGTNATGTGYQAGDNNRIRIFGSGNHIGGTDPADRNVITGSTISGDNMINLQDGAGNFIQGNYLGVNAAGTALLQQPGYGIDIAIDSGSGSNTIS